MKNLLFKIILLTLPLTARAQDTGPSDQLLVVFGSGGYILYKVLDFANDHGFPYIKILSYEFSAFDHTITGKSKATPNGGRYFELKDQNAVVSFLCFEEKPEDPYVIELEKYRFIIDDVAASAEED